MHGILSWDKPARKNTSEEHEKTYSSDSGIPGTCMPNMSLDDRKKWKAKLTKHTLGRPQVEIRKEIMETSVLIVVSLVGKATVGKQTGGNIRISANGPIVMGYTTWQTMQDAIQEANTFLKNRMEEDRNEPR